MQTADMLHTLCSSSSPSGFHRDSKAGMQFDAWFAARQQEDRANARAQQGGSSCRHPATAGSATVAGRNRDSTVAPLKEI